jgi:hypothetical protein
VSKEQKSLTFASRAIDSSNREPGQCTISRSKALKLAKVRVFFFLLDNVPSFFFMGMGRGLYVLVFIVRRLTYLFFLDTPML